MDLSSPKVKDSDKLDLCKKYFYFGCAFLPFLWAINAVWFFKEAFLRSPYDEQKSIKKLVIASAIGAVIYLAAFITWIIIFSEYRSSWGATADRLSFNIPTGTA